MAVLNFKKSVPNDHFYLQRAVAPGQITQQNICRGQEGPKSSEGTLWPEGHQKRIRFFSNLQQESSPPSVPKIIGDCVRNRDGSNDTTVDPLLLSFYNTFHVKIFVNSSPFLFPSWFARILRIYHFVISINTRFSLLKTPVFLLEINYTSNGGRSGTPTPSF
jgi:hypothetical protein